MGKGVSIEGGVVTAVAPNTVALPGSRRARGCGKTNSRAISEGPGIRGYSSRVKRMLLADKG